MIRTLYTRMAVTLAFVLALVGFIYVVFMVTTVQQNRQYTEQTLNKDLAKRLVAERNLVSENALDESALKSMFQAYMDVNPSIEIYLIDLQGKILSYSADPAKVKRQFVSLKPIHIFLKEEAMFPLLGDDPRSESRQKVFSVTAIPSSEHPSGYLYVILRGEQYDQVEQLARDEQLLQLSTWVVGIALIVSLIVGLLVFYPISRRLRTLSSQVDAFRASGFTTVTAINSKTTHDELGQLERDISLMAAQMIQQFEHISAQETLRRNLFASLSHDLRTPLATLHSYLETLQLKAAELDAEQRQEYTDRAIQYSQRLKTLVDELFEMAKLDTLQVAPHIEPFSLPELVQDILQQFEVKAQQAGITMHMIGETELPAVQGNIGMVQRVFENLIANALRHMNAEGEIEVSLRLMENKIEVQLSDTGCGMAEEELSRIFDPLYQVNNAHRAGEHSGLGLTIVRRILELHGSKITVHSQQGKGTRFTFSLPT